MDADYDKRTDTQEKRFQSWAQPMHLMMDDLRKDMRHITDIIEAHDGDLKDIKDSQTELLTQVAPIIARYKIHEENIRAGNRFLGYAAWAIGGLVTLAGGIFAWREVRGTIYNILFKL